MSGERHTESALDLLIQLAAVNPQIKTLELAMLDFAPPVESRTTLDTADEEAVSRALELRAKLRLPFWDGVMLASSELEQAPRGVLNAAVFHQAVENKVMRVEIDTLAVSTLRAAIAEAERRERLLAVTSLVHLRGGGVAHIPLLDFHVAYSEQATSLLQQIVPILGVPGTLLRSGKSYHFYGATTLTTSELAPFLGKALLFAPIVDRAWVAHQLIEGRCALRISPRREYGGPPEVLCRLLEF